MPQTLRHSPAPPGRSLELAPEVEPAPKARRSPLARGLALIVLAGGVVVLYLCLLVRISAVDVLCHEREMEREELRAVIATDLTELSSLSDTATNLDRAARNGLCPVEGRDQICVSERVCRQRQPDQETVLDEPELPSPPLTAGVWAH